MQSTAYIVYFFDDDYKIIEGVFLSKDKAETYIREGNEFNSLLKLRLQEAPFFN